MLVNVPLQRGLVNRLPHYACHGEAQESQQKLMNKKQKVNFDLAKRLPKARDHKNLAEASLASIRGGRSVYEGGR